MFARSASRDFHLFYVGRDDVHGILKYLLSRATSALYLNMFGYDDEELNAECMRCASDATITTVITLDKSQAGGKHEKAILDSDVAKDPVAFNTHVVLGQSATHQITHTKGGVLDGRVGFEGSTNWSASGEGTFVVKGRPGGPGYRAQNNTLAVFTDPDTIARFTAVAEHLAARGLRSSGARAALEGGVEGEGLDHAPIRDHRCASLIRELRGGTSRSWQPTRTHLASRQRPSAHTRRGATRSLRSRATRGGTRACRATRTLRPDGASRSWHPASASTIARARCAIKRLRFGKCHRAVGVPDSNGETKRCSVAIRS
jgi:hypothetical protein